MFSKLRLLIEVLKTGIYI